MEPRALLLRIPPASVWRNPVGILPLSGTVFTALYRDEKAHERRLQDGSLLIIGGSNAASFINSATINEPSFEHYPPKNIQGSNGLPIPSKFLNDTLNANLFPIAYLLPGGKVFVAANQQAMLYDWRSNSVQNLPRLPNGVRVTYPLTGTGILLPLTYENNYTPTMLICGGQANSDTVPPSQMSSQQTASAQCARMELSTAGIQAGWSVDMMPDPRVMPDAVSGSFSPLFPHGLTLCRLSYPTAEFSSLTAADPDMRVRLAFMFPRSRSRALPPPPKDTAMCSNRSANLMQTNPSSEV